jgi:hypothetical protein
MDKYFYILLEAIVVGIITVLVGYLAGYIVHNLEDNDLQEICKTWNKNYVMEKSLFLTGFLTHLILQISGINNWYCKNGMARVN